MKFFGGGAGESPDIYFASYKYGFQNLIVGGDSIKRMPGRDAAVVHDTVGEVLVRHTVDPVRRERTPGSDGPLLGVGRCEGAPPSPYQSGSSLRGTKKKGAHLVNGFDALES